MTIPDPSLVDVRVADVGVDAVAPDEPGPDGRTWLIVRREQSFDNAVSKAREALGFRLSEDEVKRLLRPYWPARMREPVEALIPLTSPGPGVRDRRKPVGVREPLRNRSVQLWVLGVAAVLAGVAFGSGWWVSGLNHSAEEHVRQAELEQVLTKSPLTGRVFEAYERRGGRCESEGGAAISCLDVDGVQMFGEKFTSLDGHETFEFYYDDQWVTFRTFPTENEGITRASRPKGMSATRMLIGGRLLITGSERDKVERYAMVVGQELGVSVLEYPPGSPGAPVVLFSPA